MAMRSKSQWSRIPACAAIATLIVAPVFAVDGARAQRAWDYALVWLVIFYVCSIFALLLE